MASKYPAAAARADKTKGYSKTKEKIVKTGYLSLKVDSVDRAVEEISKITSKYGGVVHSSNFYLSTGGAKQGEISIKVPFVGFEKVFAEIKRRSLHVERESTSSEDITEQYIDFQTRLNNKKAEEQSLIKLLNRANTVEDILKVTTELSKVRGEIEELQGKLELLNSKTDMSTISIDLIEKAAISLWRPIKSIRNAVSSLLGDIRWFLDFTILLIFRIIPIVTLYIALIVVIILVIRKIRVLYISFFGQGRQKQQ